MYPKKCKGSALLYIVEIEYSKADMQKIEFDDNFKTTTDSIDFNLFQLDSSFTNTTPLDTLKAVNLTILPEGRISESYKNNQNQE